MPGAKNVVKLLECARCHGLKPGMDFAKRAGGKIYNYCKACLSLQVSDLRAVRRIHALPTQDLERTLMLNELMHVRLVAELSRRSEAGAVERPVDALEVPLL